MVLLASSLKELLYVHSERTIKNIIRIFYNFYLQILEGIVVLSNRYTNLMAWLDEAVKNVLRLMGWLDVFLDERRDVLHYIRRIGNIRNHQPSGLLGGIYNLAVQTVSVPYCLHFTLFNVQTCVYLFCLQDI